MSLFRSRMSSQTDFIINNATKHSYKVVKQYLPLGKAESIKVLRNKNANSYLLEPLVNNMEKALLD